MTKSAANQPVAPSFVLPTVGAEPGNRTLWITIGAILAFGLALFLILESHREQRSVPAIRVGSRELAQGQSLEPPPLFIPPEPIQILSRGSIGQERVDGASGTNETSGVNSPLPNMAPPISPQSPAHPVIHEMPTGHSMPPNTSQAPTGIAVAVNSSPVIVMDISAGASAAEGSEKGEPAVARKIRATRARHSATIVPQGTLIEAILETALDSTQPGHTRALVSSDVINLRGDRVLIPRGSRLFGEYKGDVAAGQKRAFIQWTHLVSPDGVTIDIDSPAVDRLGRAGIKGKVNNHFLPRLGSALLQSVIDVGTLVAARSINDSDYPIFLPFPGGGMGVGSQLTGSVPKPTLKVKHGTRISVFVTRDLDFTVLEGRR